MIRFTIKSNLDQLPQEVRLEAEARCFRASLEIASLAAQLAPVDTGELSESVGVAQGTDGKTWLITVNAGHAVHVEYGTENSEAQPYLRPACNALIPELRADLRKLLK